MLSVYFAQFDDGAILQQELNLAIKNLNMLASAVRNPQVRKKKKKNQTRFIISLRRIYF
jgi:hypothetical protein